MCTQAHTPCVPHMYHMRTNAYANTHTSYVSCAHKCIRKYTYLICIMCAQMHMQIHIPHMYHVHTNAYANTHTSYVQCIQYTNTHTSYVQCTKQVTYRMPYEPYYVANKRIPRYDVSFLGYGNDKTGTMRTLSISEHYNHK